MADLIHIPEPCHEDWDDMRPEANGRHCLQCCKTVVDFTGWEMGEIVDYLKNTKGKTCGRFTTDQVQAPVQPQPEELARYVIRASVPFYRKLAAMIVLFFGLSVASCDAQKTTGAAAPVTQLPDTTRHPDPVIMGGISAPLKTDTVKPRPLMGKPVLPPHHETVKGRVAPMPRPATHRKPVPPQKPPEHLKGDVQVIEEPVKEPAKGHKP